MKIFRATSIALMFAAGLGGTALADKAAPPPAKTAPPAKTDTASDADVKEFLAFFDKLVDAIVADKDDCTKMAGSINTVVDANQKTIAMAKDAKAKGKKLPATAQQRMLDGARRMVGALDKCGHDEAVGSAFKRIDLGGRK